MHISRIVSAFAFLCGLMGADTAYGQKPVKNPQILEQFDVHEDGDALLVPITIKGQTFSFLLDTGSSSTIFDMTLRGLLGKRAVVASLISPNGVTTSETFEPPAAKLGRIDLELPGPVPARDLKMYRSISGHPIYGILGLDFLRRHIIQIDFDNKKLAILDSATTAISSLPIRYDENRLPRVNISLQGWGEEAFVIDTGMVGPGSGAARIEMIQKLARRKLAAPVTHLLTQSELGVQALEDWHVARTSLGNFCHEKLIYTGAKECILGLTYWTRYRVTLDFPNERLYLEPGRRFAFPDSKDLSGMHLLRLEGKTIVASLDEDCAAIKTGIQLGDEIACIDGCDTVKARMATLRLMLCEEGLKIVLIKPGSEQLTKSLSLKSSAGSNSGK
jgi:hypothetical protein